MTKDWDSVQDEIRKLSFNKKKSLEEVKELMERKYKFRASTRAYRMKLKEWGLMRHKPRKSTTSRNNNRATSQPSYEEDEPNRRDSSATAEPISAEPEPPTSHDKGGGWQIASDTELVEAEPTFMGLLHQTPSLQVSPDPWVEAGTRASAIVMDMLGAILESDATKLEDLIVDNINHINDPIGMPFNSPNSHFFGHPAMNQMVILQHPGQTLLDIACAMPSDSIHWILLAHGAKGSRHPLGTDLALHNAIKNGRPYTVQAMLADNRSDVNGILGTTWKPLLQAVFWNYPEVVRILLRRGADLEAAGPSPNGPGFHTALQLCLDRRAREYMKQSVREKCNEVLRVLLEAGSNIHVAPTGGSTLTTFELFTKPWETAPYWAVNLSISELDCLRYFVSRGANLQFQFDGCPCGSIRQQTFEHQALWHSTPNVARITIDGFSGGILNNGSSLLHEVLGSCPNAKRHPSDTLRDMQVLIQGGVDPNVVDENGNTPLRKCIEQCPAVDLVDRLQVLLTAGADPEAEERDGVRSFILAARTFEGPLLAEVMQLLVSKMRGHYAMTIGNASRTWSSKHFPISETQTYEQIMSYIRSTGDFSLEMMDMIPADIHQVFQRAYFSVTSKNFLSTMSKAAKVKTLTPKDKDAIVSVIGIRKDMDLADWRFDQELVTALLNPQKNPRLPHGLINTTSEDEDTIREVQDIMSPFEDTQAVENLTSTPRAPWRFNPNPPPPVHASERESQPQTPSSETDDSFIPSTTMIHWKIPSSTPGYHDKNIVFVPRYECGTCNDGVPITKKGQEEHAVEHAHTSMCEEEECERRFCVLKKRQRVDDVRCHNHLFADVM